MVKQTPTKAIEQPQKKILKTLGPQNRALLSHQTGRLLLLNYAHKAILL
jgi:hypothetical protein